MLAALMTTDTSLGRRLTDGLNSLGCEVRVFTRLPRSIDAAIDIVIVDARCLTPSDGLRGCLADIRQGIESAWILVLESDSAVCRESDVLLVGADDVLAAPWTERQLKSRLRVATAHSARTVDDQASARLQAILDSMPDGVLIAEIATRRLLRANAAATRLLGFSQEEFLGMKIEDPHPPEFRERAVAEFRRATTGPTSFSLHAPCLHKNGSRVDVHITVSPVRYRSRACLLGFFRDDRDLAVAVQAAADSDARYRTIFDHAALGILVTDLRGRVVEVNEQMAAMLGYSMGELVGRDIRSFTHPDDLARESQHFAPLLGGERAKTQADRRYLHRDGSVVWARVNASTIPPSPTSVGYFVAVVEDVTRWHAVEVALEDQRVRNRLILENSLDGIAVVDADGNFVEVNPAHCEATGYSREETLSINLLALEVDMTAEQVRERLERIKRLGSERFETQRRRKDGSLVEIEVGACHGRVDQQDFYFSFTRDITAKKRAESRLRGSESKLRNIFDHMPDTLFTVDRRGNVTFANRPPCASAMDHAPGAPWTTCIAPEHRDRARTAFEQAFRRMRAETFVFRSRLDTWFECRLVPLADDESPEAAILILTDITKRKVAVDQLRDSEHRYRLIAENVKDVIWTARFEGLSDAPGDLEDDTLHQFAERLLATWRFTYISPSVTRLLGYSPEEAMAVPPPDFFTVDSFERIKHALVAKIQREARETNEAIQDATLQVEHITKDGSIRWTEASTHLFRDAEDRIIGILGVSRDISERRRAENALRKSESVFRGLVENMPDFVVVLDTEGIIRFANRELRDASDGELVGTRAADYIRKDFREAFESALNRTFARGEVESVEVVDRFGTHWLVQMVPTTEAESEDTVMVISTDVTESRMAEAALRREQDLLRQLLELHENDRQVLAFELHDGFAQQLTGAQMMFSGAIPLIESSPDRAKEYIAKGTDLLQESIRESRRLVSGLRPPVLDEFGVVPAIEHMVTTYDEEAHPEIDFISIGHVPRMAAPLENAIYRIVQESLTNACRHSRSDHVQVQLRVAEESVDISVRDEGVGFDPHLNGEHHFGLRGIRERTRLLGGEVEIDTAPGQGVAVRVRLPLLPRVDA